MLWLRSVFFLLLIFTVGFFITQKNALLVDTSLNDLAPQFADSLESRRAINAVSNKLNQRFVLLVSSENTSVRPALNDLSIRIASNPELSVTPDSAEALRSIVNAIKPYRFKLLTTNQKEQLRSKNSIEHIADDSHQKLFSLTQNSELLPFADDPLGWHSEYIFQQLGDLTSLSSDDTKLPAVFNIQSKKLGLEEQQRILTEINKHIKAVESKYSVSVYRSGLFFFATEAASESKQNIMMISTVSMVGVFFLLLLTFRSISPLILPFISIALGVGFAFSLTHALFGSVHVLTIVFGASLIGIIIDYSLHFFYHHGQKDGQSSGSKLLLHALGLSLLTSIIGYAALSFSSIIALKKVALFSCAGLFMAWLSVICLGDLVKEKISAPQKGLLTSCLALLEKPIAALTKPIINYAVLTVLTLGLAASFLGNLSSDNPRLFFNVSEELLAQEVKVNQQINNFETGVYLVLTADNAEDIHNNFALFKAAIQSEVTLNAKQFTSLINWVPSKKEQAENYVLQKQLYKENSASSILLSKLGVQDNSITDNLFASYKANENVYLDYSILSDALKDKLPPLWVSQQEEGGNTESNHHRQSALVLVSKGVDIEALERASSNIKGVDYINSLKASTEVLRTQRISASWLLVAAYFLIGFILVIRFKNIKAASMVLVPAISSCCLILVFYALGNTLNLFHIMALFLVLGLGMDYSIFVKTMRTHLSTTHQAIFLSAITSLLSFGLLSLSAIPVVSAFGITLLIGNMCNLVGALIYSEYLKND